MDRIARIARLAAGLLLSLLSHAALAEDPLLRTQPGEILIGPLPLSQEVLGVPVDARISIFLVATPAGDRIQLDARSLVDLSDLQRKIGPLIDTIHLPSNSCARFAPDNLVARIWGKEVTVHAPDAAVVLHGDVNVCGCVKNPALCTKIENWQLVVFDCNPPLNPCINQPFDATIPISLSLPDPQSIALVIGTPSVNLGGQLGGVTGGILQIAGVNISQTAREILIRTVDPNLLRLALPDYIAVLDPAFTNAGFTEYQGNLLASVRFSVTLDSRLLSTLVGAILHLPTCASFKDLRSPGAGCPQIP
jgi:hypothetical protein